MRAGLAAETEQGIVSLPTPLNTTAWRLYWMRRACLSPCACKSEGTRMPSPTIYRAELGKRRSGRMSRAAEPCRASPAPKSAAP